MGKKAKVKVLDPGVRELLQDPGVAADLARRGQAVAAAARASAPVATGAYRDSIQMTTSTTDRAVVRVGSSDPKAFIIEAKTGNLARALDAAGG